MNTAVFLDTATVAAIDPVRPACVTNWQEYSTTSADQVASRIANAEIIITNKVPIRAEQLAVAPKLKLIAVAATGYDVIDVTAAAERNITVVNTPGYSAVSVPEHTLGLIFAVARNLIPYAGLAQDGTWSEANTFCLHTHPIMELRGSTIGIVGSGSLGRATGDLCAALGMKPVYLNRGKSAAKQDGLTRLAADKFYATADIVSLHCPLDKDNFHFINATTIEKMKPTAIIINTARGGLIDYLALITALTDGKLAGAGIDVLETEPPPADHPLLNFKSPRLVVTPHIAWASTKSQQNLMATLAETIDAFFNGQPRYIVS